MIQAKINYMRNEKDDELYTPIYATTPLLKYLPKGITIWECTDYGYSNITQVLKDSGYKVISTSKQDFDFLKDKPLFNFDMIITNPPYSLKDEFIKKCYEYKKPFCLLLPLTSLEGVKRGQLFRENTIDVLVFDRRVEYMKTNRKTGSWFNTSWFCYKVLPKQLIFEKLERKEK